MNTKKPIIHTYFVCYNEANILPHMLRYYLSFCEKVTILDNKSSDNSVEIINSFENTEVLQFNSKNSFNDDVHRNLKNSIWKSSIGIADFVILGDTDEFLYHENIIDFIVESSKKGYTVFKPEGYHMIADEDLMLKADDNIFEKVTQGVRTPVLDKPMLFDCNKIQEINYGYGCHHANPIGEVKISTDTSLKMLHFKFLGTVDYVEKNRIRAERLSEFNKVNNFGTYYLETAEEHIIDYGRYVAKREKVL